jgi:hypothetical protein
MQGPSESAFWYMDPQKVSLDQKGFTYTVEAAVPKAETKRRSWETGFIAKPEIKIPGHPPIGVLQNTIIVGVLRGPSVT